MYQFSPRTRARRRTIGLLAAAIPFLTVISCSDSTSPFPSGGPIASVTLVTTPMDASRQNIPIGQTRQVMGVPGDAAGVWVNQPVTYSSTNNARATVNADGLVTMVSGGPVGIVATTANGVADTIQFVVRYAVNTITVSPTTATVRMEGTRQIARTLLDVNNNEIVGTPVTWTSSNTAVATVSATGVVAGVTEGQATITATSEGKTATTLITVAGAPEVATVTVTPTPIFRGIGQTTQLTATARSGIGTVLTGNPVTWESSDLAVATVSNTGLVTVVGAGAATITATVEGRSGTTALTTAPAVVSGTTIAVPNLAANAVIDYAFVVPVGVTTFTLSTAGGTGDADMYVFAPNVVPGGAAPNLSGSICASFNDGNAEQCVISSAVAGTTYRVRLHAWSGGGAVSGLTLSVTHP